MKNISPIKTNFKCLYWLDNFAQYELSKNLIGWLVFKWRVFFSPPCFWRTKSLGEGNKGIWVRSQYNKLWHKQESGHSVYSLTYYPKYLALILKTPNIPDSGRGRIWILLIISLISIQYQLFSSEKQSFSIGKITNLQCQTDIAEMDSLLIIKRSTKMSKMSGV